MGLQTPGSESQSESEELTKKLLAAYQVMLDLADDLPAVVWVRWGRNGLWYFLKLPFLRWFLRYYLIHHVRRSLQTLNRRLYAIAALADDPNVNKENRETVDLYLQSLPLLPYRMMTFAILVAALLLAIPLGSFGNVLDVLPLVGSMLSFNIYYVVRSLQGNELDDTVRATIVLLLSLSVVASSLTSPFELKRMLFNLYPASKERLASTAAREHAYSIEGLYTLEERVFREVGLPRPKEGRWDLLFQGFVLLLLLLFGVCLGGCLSFSPGHGTSGSSTRPKLAPTSTSPFLKFTGSFMLCPRPYSLSRSYSVSNGWYLLCGGGNDVHMVEGQSYSGSQ